MCLAVLLQRRNRLSRRVRQCVEQHTPGRLRGWPVVRSFPTAPAWRGSRPPVRRRAVSMVGGLDTQHQQPAGPPNCLVDCRHQHTTSGTGPPCRRFTGRSGLSTITSRQHHQHELQQQQASLHPAAVMPLLPSSAPAGHMHVHATLSVEAATASTMQEQLAALAEAALSRRVLPPLLLLVMVSYLDRTALAFASLQMMADATLGLTATVFGAGAGAFFLAYSLGQVPSNFLLVRFGGPTWLSAICLAWGVAASCSAAVTGPASFIAFRLLLGLAEAGAMPGTWAYLTAFYPPGRTTMPFAAIETGITLSQVVAAPWAAALLLLNGAGGLAGWRWLLLLEGVPALVLGCCLRTWLPASLDAAHFLTAAQREALKHAASAGAGAAADDEGAQQPAGAAEQEEASTLLLPQRQQSSSDSKHWQQHQHQHQQQHELPRHHLDPAGVEVGGSSRSGSAVASGQPEQHQQHQQHQHHSSEPGSWAAAVWAAASNRAVLYAGCWRILHDIAGVGILFFTPRLLQVLLSSASAPDDASQQGGSTGARAVLLSAVPYCAASLVHLANAWHSQRVGEARLHISLTWLVGAAALCMLPVVAGDALGCGGHGVEAGSASTVAAFAVLTIAHCGINGANGLQTALVARSLPVSLKALGLAAYNTLGGLGGALGPLLIGVLHDSSGGSYAYALWLLGASLACAALMVWRFRAPGRPP